MKGLKMLILTAFVTLFTAVSAFGETVRVIQIDLTYNGKTVQYREQEVSVIVDGKRLENLDMPAVIIDDRTLVPLRAIFESMGASVSWDGDTQKITADFENGGRSGVGGAGGLAGAVAAGAGAAALRGGVSVRPGGPAGGGHADEAAHSPVGGGGPDGDAVIRGAGDGVLCPGLGAVPGDAGPGAAAAGAGGIADGSGGPGGGVAAGAGGPVPRRRGPGPAPGRGGIFPQRRGTGRPGLQLGVQPDLGRTEKAAGADAVFGDRGAFGL